MCLLHWVKQKIIHPLICWEPSSQALQGPWTPTETHSVGLILKCFLDLDDFFITLNMLTLESVLGWSMLSWHTVIEGRGGTQRQAASRAADRWIAQERTNGWELFNFSTRTVIPKRSASSTLQSTWRQTQRHLLSLALGVTLSQPLPLDFRFSSTSLDMKPPPPPSLSGWTPHGCLSAWQTMGTFAFIKRQRFLALPSLCLPPRLPLPLRLFPSLSVNRDNSLICHRPVRLLLCTLQEAYQWEGASELSDWVNTGARQKPATLSRVARTHLPVYEGKGQKESEPPQMSCRFFFFKHYLWHADEGRTYTYDTGEGKGT